MSECFKAPALKQQQQPSIRCLGRDESDLAGIAPLAFQCMYI